MVSVLDQALPSADYLALVRTPSSRLVEVARRGGRPDVQALAGWEWRGTNMPASSRLLGLRRFIKGFVAGGGGQLDGYNVSVAGSNLSSPWKDRRQRDGRREWARFTVAPVDPEAIDNRYLQALLLDYGGVATPEPGIAGSDTGLSRAGRARLGRVVARSGVPGHRSGSRSGRMVRPRAAGAHRRSRLALHRPLHSRPRRQYWQCARTCATDCPSVPRGTACRAWHRGRPRDPVPVGPPLHALAGRRGSTCRHSVGGHESVDETYVSGLDGESETDRV